MRLEERLEERAGRAASGDPRAVLEAARARADVAGGGRPRRRALVAVAAIVTLFALGAAGLGVLRGEDRALTARAPDDAIPSAAPDEAITSDVPTVEGGWRLVATVRGEARQPVGGGVPITITISGDDVTGSDGCNGLETWLEDGTVSEPGIRTLIGCGDPEVVDLFWRVLDQTPAYELRDDELWLDAAGGDSLVFARSEGRGGTGAGELSAPDEPSVSDAEAQQVFSEMVAIAAERTLRRWTGSVGCRRTTATASPGVSARDRTVPCRPLDPTSRRSCSAAGMSAEGHASWSSRGTTGSGGRTCPRWCSCAPTARSSPPERRRSGSWCCTPARSTPGPWRGPRCTTPSRMLPPAGTSRSS